MFKTKLLLTLALLQYDCVSAQNNFNATDFTNSIWVAQNEKRNFLISGSFNLIRIANDTSDLESKKPHVADYFLTDYVQLEFFSKGRLKLKEIDIEQHTSTEKVGTYSWKFSKRYQKMSLFFNDKRIIQFCLYSKDKIVFRSTHTYLPPVEGLMIKSKICD